MLDLKLNYQNGAHFEYKALNYLLQHFFPEFNIPNQNPCNNKCKIYKYKLNVSFNIDGFKDKSMLGKRIKNAMEYNIDKEIDFPYIFMVGEYYDVSVINHSSSEYIIISSLNITEKKCGENNVFRIPLVSIAYIQFFLSNYLIKYVNNAKKAEYLLGYCASRRTNTRTAFMNTMLKNIDDNNRVICFGGDSNYHCKINRLKKINSSNLNMIDEYSNCDFVCAIENNEVDGYITEKILNVFVSGAIPIYWGDHKYAKTLFNPKSFICIRDFKDIEHCVQFILKMSDEEIIQMKKEPMFKDNIIPDIFNIHDFSEDCIYGKLRTKCRELVFNSKKCHPEIP